MTFIPDCKENEIWKKIEGMEEKYEVSNYGQVRSLIFRNKQTNKKRDKPLILKGNNSHGYKYATLRFDNKRIIAGIHWLVLEAFVGKRPKGFEACHYDGNRKNNKLSNLRWDTHKNNMGDAVRHGTMKKKTLEDNHNSKLKIWQVRLIKKMYKKNIFGRGSSVLAKKFGVSSGCIMAIINGNNWRTLDVCS